MLTPDEARKLSENAEEINKEKHRQDIYNVLRKQAEQGNRSCAFELSEYRAIYDFQPPLKNFMKKELEDLGYILEYVEHKNTPDVIIIKW